MANDQDSKASKNFQKVQVDAAGAALESSRHAQLNISKTLEIANSALGAGVMPKIPEFTLNNSVLSAAAMVASNFHHVVADKLTSSVLPSFNYVFEPTYLVPSSTLEAIRKLSEPLPGLSLANVRSVPMP